jgi:hypothetical protein
MQDHSVRMSGSGEVLCKGEQVNWIPLKTGEYLNYKHRPSEI